MVDFTQIRIPAQVLAELHHVLRRKALYDASEAHARIARYQDTIAIIPTDSSVLTAACDLASRHNLPTYDAIILAAAAQAECDTLYSEDMQHGFEWRGVRIVNPFA